MSKIDFSKIYDDTLVGSIQRETEKIINNILADIKKGRTLDEAIRYADCSGLDYLSEETPMALPLGDPEKPTRTIGLAIQGNEFRKEEGQWETFDLITVEVPEFLEYN